MQLACATHASSGGCSRAAPSGVPRAVHEGHVANQPDRVAGGSTGLAGVRPFNSHWDSVSKDYTRKSYSIHRVPHVVHDIWGRASGRPVRVVLLSQGQSGSVCAMNAVPGPRTMLMVCHDESILPRLLVAFTRITLVDLCVCVAQLDGNVTLGPRCPCRRSVLASC